MKKIGIILCLIIMSACGSPKVTIDTQHIEELAQSNKVSLTRDSDLFASNDENEMVKVGTISANTVVDIDQITDLENTYIKLKDSNLYLNYEDIQVSEKEIDISYQTRYVPFAFYVKTSPKFELENEFGRIQLELQEELQVYKEYDGYYVVEFQNQLWNLEKEDVEQTIAQEASTNVATNIPVFMYHFFYDETIGENGVDGNFMEIHRFEEHMLYAKENGYQAVTMTDLQDHLYGHVQLPKGSFVFTMDDNAESVKRLAYPTLEKNETYATSFVISSWVEDFEPLKSKYVELQSHTDNMHRGGCTEQHGGALLCATTEEIVTDLQTSSEKLGGAFVVAYPFGDHSEHVINALKEAGYTMAFTVEPGYVTKEDDPFALPRVRISTETTVEVFAKKLEPAKE